MESNIRHEHQRLSEHNPYSRFFFAALALSALALLGAMLFQRQHGEYVHFALAVSASAALLACVGLSLTVRRQGILARDLMLSKERYRLLLDGAESVIVSIDDAGTILFINPYGAAAFDKTVEDCVGRHFAEAFPEAFAACVAQTIAAAKDGAASHSSEVQVSSGAPTAWYRVTARLWVRATGQPAMLVTASDVTEVRRSSEELRATNDEMSTIHARLLASRNDLHIACAQLEVREKELQSSQEMLLSVMDNIPMGIFWKDRNSVYLGANRTFLEHIGPDAPAHIEGMTDGDMPWRAQAADYQAKDRRVMENDKPEIDYYERVRFLDGKSLWFRKSKFPLHGHDGAVVGVLGVYEDVTEQKMGRDKLHRTFEFQGMIGKILLAAQQRVPLRGRLDQVLNEVLGFTWSAVMKAGAVFSMENDGTLRLQASRRLPEEFSEDGADLPVGLCLCGKNIRGTALEFHSQPAGTGEDGGPDVMGGHYCVPLRQDANAVGLMLLYTAEGERLDGDEEVNLATVATSLAGIIAQAHAEEASERFIAAVEQVSEGIVITDTEGTIGYVNPAFEAVSGYKRGELVGRKPSVLRSGKHDAAFYRNLWETIKRGEVWRGHMVNRRKDGVFWEEDDTIAPLRDRSGRIVNYVAIKRDVTDEMVRRKHRRQVQRIEAIGTLAGGIAHEFNNILTAVLGYAELGLAHPGNAALVGNALREVLKTGTRAKELVGQVLTFSRQTEQERAAIRVQEAVEDALSLMRGVLPSAVRLFTALDAKDAIVLADPAQIKQIVVNLCTNAAQAMEDREGGRLDVSLKQLDTSAEAAFLLPELADGAYVCLSVRDTGRGMGPEVAERVFDPFFTTKPIGQGTGLGLSTVHGIVMLHGGAVRVYSEPGNGSAFHVYLPCIGSGESVQPVSLPVSENGAARILFVDDEPEIAALGGQLLPRLGYRVSVFGDSEKALQAFRQGPDNYDLVITDIAMPGLTGVELVQQIRRLRPAMPVVLMTGLSEATAAEQTRGVIAADVVAKPFAVRELNERIRAALDGALRAGAETASAG